jgi:hypothetical protein
MHTVVVVEHQHDSVFLRQARQGLSDLALRLVAKNFGKRGWGGMIEETLNVDFFRYGTFLVLSAAELIDAVMGGDLRKPRTERHHLVFLVQNSIKLQEDFSGGILSIFGLAKKLSAGL